MTTLGAAWSTDKAPVRGRSSSGPVGPREPGAHFAASHCDRSLLNHAAVHEALCQEEWGPQLTSGDSEVRPPVQRPDGITKQSQDHGSETVAEPPL